MKRDKLPWPSSIWRSHKHTNIFSDVEKVFQTVCPVMNEILTREQLYTHYTDIRFHLKVFSVVQSHFSEVCSSVHLFIPLLFFVDMTSCHLCNLCNLSHAILKQFLFVDTKRVNSRLKFRLEKHSHQAKFNFYL